MLSEWFDVGERKRIKGKTYVSWYFFHQPQNNSKGFWFRADKNDNHKKVMKKANLSKEWGAKPPALIDG